MKRIVPATIIEHCGECSLIDTVKCPHQKDGVDYFNWIPDDCPLERLPESKINKVSITGKHFTIKVNHTLTELAESILNLLTKPRECGLCGGTGSKDYGEGDTECNDCHGTGQLPPYLVELCEDQTLPENPCPCGVICYPDKHKCNADDLSCPKLAEYLAQQDMIQVRVDKDGRKVKWVRVYVD